MAGGQATNAGIEYQQRVAAWCLINQFVDFDISKFLDHIDDELIIQKALFETDKPIDDLNLECKNKRKVYLQIKKTISLSTKAGSDFLNVIWQFTKEFVDNPTSKDYFGLITTSDSSSKIRNDLKKISVSVRLNKHGLINNPLNESEQDTLVKLRQVFWGTYRELTGNEPNEDIFIRYTKKMFVAVFDIEPGQTNEIACLMLLSTHPKNRE